MAGGADDTPPSPTPYNPPSLPRSPIPPSQTPAQLDRGSASSSSLAPSLHPPAPSAVASPDAPAPRLRSQRQVSKGKEKATGKGRDKAKDHRKGRDKEKGSPPVMPPPIAPAPPASALATTIPSGPAIALAAPLQPVAVLRPGGHAVPKIPIPRLPREYDVETPGGFREGRDKHREYRLRCFYGDGKRDRARKELYDLQDKVDEYERLLRDLSRIGDPATQMAIQTRLASPELGGDDDASALSYHARKRLHASARAAIAYESGGDGPKGEDLVSAEVGSTGSMDHVTEDFDRDEDAVQAGYFGKTSDVAWIHRARTLADAETDAVAGPEHGGSGPPPLRARPFESRTPSDRRSRDQQDYKHRPSTYHLDDLQPSLVDPVGEWNLPPKEVADTFVEAYFATVHPCFPLLHKARFLDSYDQCYRSSAAAGGRRWRAMLNLILAIGAKYAILVQADLGDERDHLIFFTRARALSLDRGPLWDVGDLEQVQMLGVTVMYLMASNQTNRAWYISGLAVRYAQALGLHLRNEARSYRMSRARKEQAVRVWWALYSLENLLGTMTGRPSAVMDREITTPLPPPSEEESPGRFDEASSGAASSASPHTSASRFASRSPDEPRPRSSTRSSPPLRPPSAWPSSRRFPSSRSPGSTPLTPATFFLLRTKLHRLIHHVSSDLYHVGAARYSWSRTQRSISTHLDALEQWQVALPNAYDFRKSHPDPSYLRERLDLGMLYWSAILLLGRPCLCRFEGKIPNESLASQEFNRVTAVRCVSAAREFLKLLPDEPDPPGLYGAAPWWGVLHHLSQAASVIMLELCFRAQHVPAEAHEVLADAKKAVNWLRAMARQSVAADRAWHLLDGLLQRVAPGVGGDTSEMPHLSSRRTTATPPSSLALMLSSPTQAETFGMWQQSEEQQRLFREVEDALGESFLYGTAPLFLDPTAGPGYDTPDPSMPAIPPPLPPLPVATGPPPSLGPILNWSPGAPLQLSPSQPPLQPRTSGRTIAGSTEDDAMRP
ncbi:MAG: hypothetical protein M1838_003104 [Thelocarpon superellum]|nr:MAG: hypothetical protein M1838_003104 [Thelocarpon superellum]